MLKIAKNKIMIIKVFASIGKAVMIERINISKFLIFDIAFKGRTIRMADKDFMLDSSSKIKINPVITTKRSITFQKSRKKDFLSKTIPKARIFKTIS